MKRVVSIFTAFVIAVSMCGAVTAYADDTAVNEFRLTAEELQSNPTETLENLFQEAKDKATDENPYKIYVPAGTYLITDTLHLYSNTELYLDENTVFQRDASFIKGNMIKAGKDSETSQGYNGYRNIVVDGGTWDAAYIVKASSTESPCIMRFGHCTNVTVSNLTMRRIKNNHHMEIAAIDGFTLKNCTFTEMERVDTDSSCEAVQIDIIHDSAHFPSYSDYDDTPCKNITVSGCTFNGVYAGIGTRSGVAGRYFDNMVITGNTFNNITDKAVSCFNYRNSTISNNTFNGVTLGIVFEYLPNDSTIGNRMYTANDNITGEIVQKSSSVISGNNITVSNTNTSTYNCGIYVYGGEVDAQQASDNGVPAGDYTIKDVEISSNTISCYTSSARGIFVTGLNCSDITGNHIVDYAAASSGINAINICGSKRNTISSNTITGSFNNGISIYNDDDTPSKKNSISSNSINAVQSYGIRISNTSYATIKNNNSITSCGISPLCIKSVNYNQNLANVTLGTARISGRGKPIIKIKSVDSGNTGYKIYRAAYGGSFKQVATVKNDRLVYEDKSARIGTTYYYQIVSYKTVNSTVIISTNHVDATISC